MFLFVQRLPDLLVLPVRCDLVHEMPVGRCVFEHLRCKAELAFLREKTKHGFFTRRTASEGHEKGLLMSTGANTLQKCSRA